MIVPRHYEDLKIVHENTIALSSLIIVPSSHDMGPLVENRYASRPGYPRLNGTWQFQYFKSIL